MLSEEKEMSEVRINLFQFCLLLGGAVVGDTVRLLVKQGVISLDIYFSFLDWYSDFEDEVLYE